MATTTEQKLLQLVERMPAFPNSVQKVLELTANIDCAPRDLVKVIEHDPVLTLKILKLVNSAYFGLSRPISSINHAVVYVGLNTIKNLALSVATIGMLPRRNPAGFDMQGLLLHSLAVATISRLLGRRLGMPDSQLTNYFVAGLLHDIGKAVFAQYLPQEFNTALDHATRDSIPLYEAEREAIGADHARMGSALARSWQLPAELVAAIDHHHRPEEDPTPLTDALFVANQLAKSLQIGASGTLQVELLPDATRERFGMGLLEILDTLTEVEQELDNARVFMNL